MVCEESTPPLVRLWVSRTRPRKRIGGVIGVDTVDNSIEECDGADLLDAGFHGDRGKISAERSNTTSCDVAMGFIIPVVILINAIVHDMGLYPELRFDTYPHCILTMLSIMQRMFFVSVTVAIFFAVASRALLSRG